ncbi:MAG: MBL fold metallo-hydrolase [Lentisphaeria bacterium]|nr:MBL fold metallo-hydrolase [Lentisphaeria bacterium]
MTTLYQLELDQTNVNCGSSHVIQLESGAFIIIDGGYFTPGEEDRLYRFLAERSDGMPVITAWFFSHAHQDHIGNFIQFVKKYKPRVRIQRLLYSFQPIDLSNATGDWKSSDPATVNAFYQTLESHCADIERVTPRTGDVLSFDELTLEVLYTYEDLYPEPASFNSYSTVIMTTVGQHKILWLGDTSATSADVLLRHPENLTCDVVQVAHHGIDNHERLCQLYAATRADVALWPTPDYAMVARRDQAVNHFLLYDTGIQEHLVSGYGTITMPLPYRPGMAAKSPKALTFTRQPDSSVTFANGLVPDSAFRYLTPDKVDPVIDEKTSKK